MVFIVKRGFTPSQLGLTFIGVGIGVVLAGLLFVYQGRDYAELQVKWNGHPPPEERLYGEWMCSSHRNLLTTMGRSNGCGSVTRSRGILARLDW